MRYLMELGRGRLTKHEMVLYVNGRGHYADGKGFIADVRRAEQVDIAAAAAAATAAAAAAVAAAAAAAAADDGPAKDAVVQLCVCVCACWCVCCVCASIFQRNLHDVL